jgi:hypothetical protein
MDVHMTTQKQEQATPPPTKTGPLTAPSEQQQKDGPPNKGLLGDERPFDFIERTKPEDRLPPETAHGQITRDNVNPNIPSSPKGGERGMGIVDPNSLHMEQGVAGAAVPKAPEQPKQQTTGTPPLAGQGVQGSINEPAGSTLGSNMDASGQPIQGGEDKTPVVTAVDPDECTIGDEDFDIFVHGTGFGEDSVIVFAGQDEPTDLEDDGSLSTGIDMSLWQGEDTVKVSVKNGDKTSNEVDFTFHATPATRKAPAKQDKRKGKGVKAKAKKGKR